MSAASDYGDPDEARPMKRARLEAPLDITNDVQDEVADEDLDDDWDDVYGDDAKANDDAEPDVPDLVQPSNSSSDPLPTSNAPSTLQPPTPISPQTIPGGDSKLKTDGSAAEPVVDADDELVVPPPVHEGADAPSQVMLEETTQIVHEPSTTETSTENIAASASVDNTTSSNPVPGTSDVQEARAKSREDAEFMAAAEAQQGDENAEWQFDSSDAESSSDSDSSDSDDSDADSDDDYELLDAATAAKILMHGDGDDEDGEKSKSKTGAEHQPRTINEVKEVVIEKPNITITPDMEITLLGNVQGVVENMVLIKGATPGEYQVLESGSVLCNEKREVLGAVAETFGKVQEPLYSLAFTNGKEIEEAGLQYGVQIFYVNSHSEFVFTQPLKSLKGYDASNMHDEEVGEDEMEFSDDEVEAAYKRESKLSKKAGNGPLSRSAFDQAKASAIQDHDNRPTHARSFDAPAQTYGGGLSYDDGEGPEEFYQLNKRPDNLSAYMAGAIPPPPRPAPQTFDRGRGRGRGDFRGRGRGDRGRGRGGFGGRGRGGSESGHGNQRGGGSHRGDQRGGRGGGHDSQSKNHRGSAHSFPDRHNNASNEHQQIPLPPQPQGISVSPHQQYPTGHAQGQYQQPAPPTYQFNGYTFQQPTAPTPHAYYAQQPQQSAGSMPPGGTPYAQYPAPANPAGGHVPSAPSAPLDISEILRRLGAGSRQ